MKCYKAPYTLASKHTRAHIPHLPSCLWPNLSDLSHPWAFSSVCPSWTLVHLTAPRGAFLIAQPDLRCSSWGWHPPGMRWRVGGGGGRCGHSAPRQQPKVKSFRLMIRGPENQGWYVQTCHKHRRWYTHTNTLASTSVKVNVQIHRGHLNWYWNTCFA